MTVVLIVDDSPLDRVLASSLLKKQAQCEILLAEDGQEGLAAMEQHLPDLVLTDMQMPVMNGLEMIIEARNKGLQSPIVLMTATGSEELAVEALRLGAASYVPKRSLAKRLISTARRVLAAANESRQKSLLAGRLESHSESFRLSSQAEECRTMAGYLQTSLSQIWELSSTRRLRLGLVLEEALLNALYHGNLEVSSELKELADHSFEDLASRRETEAPYCDRCIDVDFSTTSDAARFVIRDEGRGFDLSRLPDPTNPENLTRPSGRGVLLMRTFMDEVRFNDRGNEVTMVLKKEIEI